MKTSSRPWTSCLSQGTCHPCPNKRWVLNNWNGLRTIQILVRLSKPWRFKPCLTQFLTRRIWRGIPKTRLGEKTTDHNWTDLWSRSTLTTHRATTMCRQSIPLTTWRRPSAIDKSSHLSFISSSRHNHPPPSVYRQPHLPGGNGTAPKTLLKHSSSNYKV
jgi:hypothetical protein